MTPQPLTTPSTSVAIAAHRSAMPAVHHLPAALSGLPLPRGLCVARHRSCACDELSASRKWLRPSDLFDHDAPTPLEFRISRLAAEERTERAQQRAACRSRPSRCTSGASLASAASRLAPWLADALRSPLTTRARCHPVAESAGTLNGSAPMPSALPRRPRLRRRARDSLDDPHAPAGKAHITRSLNP